MEQVIKVLSDEFIYINYNMLQKRQKDIWQRYEDTKLIDISNKNYIKILNEYLLNILEEAAEASEYVFNIDEKENYILKDTIYNEGIKKLFMEEVVDIFNYSATLLSILYNTHYNGMDKEKFNEMKFEIINSYSLKFPTKLQNIELTPDFYKINFAQFIAKINTLVMKIRRLFPERKWHKPYKEKTDGENITRLLLSISLSCQLLAIIGNMLYSITSDVDKNKNLDYINMLINNKFDFIKNLPSVD